MRSRTSTVLEVISASAVVVSLVFVGFEIRNSSEQTELNTQALKIAAYQDLIGRIVEINKFRLEGLIDIENARANPPIDESEIRNYHAILWILFRHSDMAYFQFKNGAISEERMRSALGPLADRLRNRFVQERWDDVKSNFVPAYQSYIDQLIKELNDATEK